MKGRTAPIAADASDRLLNPRFVAILAAQVFSLLGMEILQFVLPLHLLNLTGSGTLYGGVLAAGFVPYTLLAPVGGVVADRTRKRGVMVAVDATLAAVMAAYLALEGSSGIVALTIAVLMVAFAAQALYQPCVQSAMPHVVSPRHLEQAVAVTNQVGMVTSIAGPVAGGLALGFWGIGPIVALSAGSFAVAAALAAAFVRVPYEPPARTAGPLETVRGDLSEALGFLRSHPFFLRVIVAATLANLFGSSYFNVGAPYVVTESLGLTNQHMGALQGAIAVGGLAGGAVVALRPGGLGIARVPGLLAGVAAGIAASAAVLALPLGALGTYAGLVVVLLVTMGACVAMSIVATSYLQMRTPGTLVGKVMALAVMLANFATPVGQLVYGIAFDHVTPWAVGALAAIAVAVVAAWLGRSPREGE